MAKACNNQPQVFTISNKTDITTPNYPDPYENNMDCEWNILMSKDRNIELIVDGELEAKYAIFAIKLFEINTTNP